MLVLLVVAGMAGLVVQPERVLARYAALVADKIAIGTAQPTHAYPSPTPTCSKTPTARRASHRVARPQRA